MDPQTGVNSEATTGILGGLAAASMIGLGFLRKH
ncbi:hypothetical protein C6Y10_09955 [Lactiplantibacillus pentosus]|nr:hypothetical protein C6Y10_09955 [Lactiplantibacillus pentosus]